MLPSKLRIATVVAFVLFVPLMTMTGQPPAAQNAPERKLQDLLKERLEVARKLAKQVKLRMTVGQLKPEDALAPMRLPHEAALDLCQTDAERIQAWKQYLEVAKDNERIINTFFKTGQGPESALLQAKAERLRVEIELARLQGQAGGKAKAPAAPQPKKAAEPRVSTQPGTIEAFESVRLFSRISGFLKTQSVDIGSLVKRDQVLAVVETPELEIQVRQDRAELDQARAKVEAAKARVKVADAEAHAARAAVKQAEADVARAAAIVRYRAVQVQRMEELYKNRSIEEKVIEEIREQHAAAKEAEKAARLAVGAAQARASAGAATLDNVKAELRAAEAGVAVAQTRLEMAQARLAGATIVAPFDGVVTQRGFYVGDFIRPPGDRAKPEPLLTVERLDRFRIVVMIPDRDVPFVEAGDPADFAIDALPGKKWSTKVSRVAGYEDPKTRRMRVELDVANPDRRLRSGMYGIVTIRLGERKQ